MAGGDSSEHEGLGKGVRGQDPSGFSHQDPPERVRQDSPGYSAGYPPWGPCCSPSCWGRGPRSEPPLEPTGLETAGHRGWGGGVLGPLAPGSSLNQPPKHGAAGPGISPHPPRAPPVPPQLDWRQVLVLGLDGAGKSSVLHYICSQTARDHIAPTHGFNSAQLSVQGLEMDLLEGKGGLAPTYPPGLSLHGSEGTPRLRAPGWGFRASRAPGGLVPWGAAVRRQPCSPPRAGA